MGNESEDTRSFQRKQISSTMLLCIGVVAVFAAYAIYKDNTVLIDRVLGLVSWVIAAVIVGKQSAKPRRE